MKSFNTTAVCIPEKHYMVDLSERIPNRTLEKSQTEHSKNPKQNTRKIPNKTLEKSQTKHSKNPKQNTRKIPNRTLEKSQIEHSKNPK